MSIDLNHNHFGSKYFLNSDGSLKKEGDIVKIPKLAFTMEIIARNPESFYTGDLAKDIIKDIQDASLCLLSGFA